MTAVRLVLALLLMNQITVLGSRVLLALYMLDLGASPFTVGLLAGTFSVIPALLSVPVGRWVDRHGARLPLWVGALSGGLGMLAPWFFASIPAMFAAALGIGLSSALYNVTLQNLVGQLGTPASRARDFSNYSLMNSSASFVGPLIAGFSLDHLGPGPACLVLAVIALGPVSLLLSGKVPMGGVKRAEAAHASGRFRDLLSGPGIRRARASGSLQNAGDVLSQFYLPVYCHSIGLSASTIGILLALAASAAFVVRFTLPQMIRRAGELKLLAIAFYVGAAALSLIPLFTSPVMLGLLSFCMGLSLGCTGPIVTMQMFSNAPPGRSGEAVGMKVTVNHCTKVVAPMLYGSLANAVGLLPVFLMIAVLFGGGGWINRPANSGPRAPG